MSRSDSPRASAALVSWCSSAVGSRSSRAWSSPRSIAPADAVARRRGAELGGRALGEDAAVLDDRDAVAERLRLVEVVRRQQDRLAELLQAADRLPGGAPRGRVEAGRRLVEEDQLRVADERQREVQAPQLAAGQRARAGVRPAPRARRSAAPRRDRAARGRGRPSGATASRTSMWRYMPQLWSTMPTRSRSVARRARRDRGRAPRRSRRCAAGSPRGSRRSSSCRRRWARAGRRPRRSRPRSRSRAPPRTCRRTCAGRGRGWRAPRRSPTTT